MKSPRSLHRSSTDSGFEHTWEPISELKGSWLSHLDIEGKRYWTLGKDLPYELVEEKLPIPSDCRLREDLQSLYSSDVKSAQKAKEVKHKPIIVNIVCSCYISRLFPRKYPLF